MKTGEGKTLVATLPVYLNALSGKGVHVVTVNDYLARRDADWMGQIYTFLGLSVGVIVHGLDDNDRKLAYDCDITYGTNNEYGFDYLRDNMKYDFAQMVQRGHNYAIVDEVDSILIDEARTPLIISGPIDDRSDLYVAIDALIPRLASEDFDLDEKQRTVSLTEAGNEKMDGMLREAGVLKEGDLYDAHNATLVHHVNQALRAHKLFQRDKDYIVRNGEVVIIDEFTGRMMPGRRYSEGLHQGLEAKERVQIQPENQTLASITFQNYFRLYDKLAGMTGTAATEADEFQEIYNLQVVEIPTNVAVARVDEDDQVYRTVEEKYKAIIEEIETAHRRQQPVLVGTGSIEKSELLAEFLTRARLPADRLLGPEGAGRALRRRSRGAGLEAVRGAERPLPRAGSLHRGRGRRAGGHHHRHQHGRARHRHQARRQCRDAHRTGGRRSPGRAREGRRSRGHQGRGRGQPRRRARRRSTRPIRQRAASTTCRAASTSSAPSATNPGASTTSCAAAPAARAIPDARSSTCRSRTT